ncbi:MAG: HWE histidine kinase domain-containing protein [Balneolales bacterium]
MTDKPSREIELEKRLREAEEILDALRNQKVDAVIGTNQLAMLRLKEVEDKLHEQMQIADNRLKEIETIYRNVPVGLCVIDRGLRFTRVNEHLAKMNGIPAEEHLGRKITEVLPKLAQDIEPDLRQLIETGKPRMNVELNGQTPAQPGVERYWLEHWLPLHGEQDRIIGINVVIEEITERKKAQQTQRLLLGELNHRIKNNIATIQAIADQTLQQSGSPAEFVEGFKGRLQILARSHTLLTRSKWEGAYIDDILKEQLILNQKTDRIVFTGPRIFLASQAALHLALVLHELGTNAGKHGSLSVPAGRLQINWDLQSDYHGSAMKLVWVELGGPAIQEVHKQGFGMPLIERSLKAVGGDTSITFDPSGLRCEITLPLLDDHNTPEKNSYST